MNVNLAFRLGRARPAICAALAAIPALALAALAADEEGAVHVVSASKMNVRAEEEGRIEAAHREKVRVTPEAYGGPLRVAEVARDRGRVADGEVLFRIDPSRLDDELRSAREARDHARIRLELLEAEQKVQQDAKRIEVERAARSSDFAEQAVALFERFHGPKMLRAAELDVAGRENGVKNQREELAQLEKMYQGTELAAETKEIVIERARRGLALAEAWLGLERGEETITREFNHPKRGREVRDEARWAADALKHAKEHARIAEARRKVDLEAAQSALRSAEERVARLEQDRERLAVRAPLAGILDGLDIAPGDFVEGRKVLGYVLVPDRLVVRLRMGARELRVLSPGKRVTVAVPELGLEVPGSVGEIGLAGSDSKEGTVFPVEVAIESSDPRLRLGLRATVRAEGTLADALSVPGAAVRARDGKAYCVVRTERGRAEREVTTGAREGDRVEVLTGLKVGDEVILDAAAGAKEEAPAKAPPPASPGTKKGSAGERDGEKPASERKGVSAPRSAEEAFRGGIAFLLMTQNKDGSFGSFVSSRPGEIYLGTVASHRAFLDATTALCVMALQGPSRTDPAARAALERGVDYLLRAGPVARAMGHTFYDTWTHAYALEALARIHADERFAARRAAIGPVIRREIEVLERRQAAEGGYGYYDFEFGGKTPAGDHSTSFLTAVVLLAFDAARGAGFEPGEATIADSLACVERLRLPSGAYVYGTYAQMRPGVLYNQVKGSLGRSQPCNLALFRFGRRITKDALALGIENFREHHHFLEIGKSRPYPHEAWYYTAGYYFLFGHYYAARILRELDPAEQKKHAPWLAGTIARLQDPDGSWFDYPLYGYHKQYGTAFACLTIEECLALAKGGEGGGGGGRPAERRRAG